jgi:hypothetical protein
MEQSGPSSVPEPGRRVNVAARAVTKNYERGGADHGRGGRGDERRVRSVARAPPGRRAWRAAVRWYRPERRISMTRMTPWMIALALAGAACKKDEGAGAPAPSRAGDAVTFTWRPAAVGDREQLRETLTTELTIAAPDEEGAPMTQRQQGDKRIEVLEVANQAATKIKVEYVTWQETNTLGDQVAEGTSPLAGKTYLVWIDGTTIRASDEAGGAISPEEEEALAEDWAEELGAPPGLARVATARPWRVGEPVTLSPEDLASLNASERKAKARAGTMTLVAHAGGVATFDLDLQLQHSAGPDALDMTMKITAQVDAAHTRLRELTMRGTLEGAMGGARVSGTMSGTATRTRP